MDISQMGLRFWVGVVLLTTNQPLGWGGIVVCNAIAIEQQDSFFTYVGAGIYALSWLMLGVGVWMAGPQGVTYAKESMQKLLRRSPAPAPIEPNQPPEPPQDI